VNLGRNWRSSLRSTDFDLGLKVDIEDRAKFVFDQKVGKLKGKKIDKFFVKILKI